MRLALPLLLALAGTSCVLDASIGRDDPESAGEGGGGAFTDSAADSGTASESGRSVDTEAGGGEGGGGETRGDDEPTGVADTETDMLPPLCHPTDGDTECAQCRKGHCCDQIIHCHDAPGCFCFWDCVAHADASLEECGIHCDYDGEHFAEVVACQHELCSDVCEDGNPTDLPPDVPMD